MAISSQDQAQNNWELQRKKDIATKIKRELPKNAQAGILDAICRLAASPCFQSLWGRLITFWLIFHLILVMADILHLKPQAPYFPYLYHAVMLLKQSTINIQCVYKKLSNRVTVIFLQQADFFWMSCEHNSRCEWTLCSVCQSSLHCQYAPTQDTQSRLQCM